MAVSIPVSAPAEQEVSVRGDRSDWTLPKSLYLFVRYYSLITLMCVPTFVHKNGP